jgi:hypothetical protein
MTEQPSNVYGIDVAAARAGEAEILAAAHGPDGRFEVVVVDERTWSALAKALPITPGVHEVLVRHQDRLCGDYPAPCNCNNPTIHDGH